MAPKRNPPSRAVPKSPAKKERRTKRVSPPDNMGVAGNASKKPATPEKKHSAAKVKSAKKKTSPVKKVPSAAKEIFSTESALKGRKVTPAGSWLQSPDAKGKDFLLERLPGELRYNIYDEVLGDMGPNLTYVTIRYVSKRRRCVMSLGDMSKESKWRWGDDLIEAIPEMQPHVERSIGTHRQIRDEPLRTVRKDKDVAVYCFDRCQNAVDWRLLINKTESIRTLGPGIQNVGVRIGGPHSGGLKSMFYACSQVICGRGIDCKKICPAQLADFIDHFADVKTVYLLVMLQAHQMRVAKSKATVRSLIKDLVDRSDVDSRAKFEDRSRVWVELGQKEAKGQLNDETYSIFRVARQTGHLLTRGYGLQRSLALGKRKAIKFRILVTSFYLQ
ncbi:hypothetical protein ACHAQH_006096 [Verticillium albo-atrum]